jgi:16S rRNA processing protein RimM
VELGENEYFIADLIGMKAVSDEGEELGVISDVLQTGANDVYVIGSEGTADLLVPAIKDCIRIVDMEQKVMTIHLLPGLRD